MVIWMDLAEMLQGLLVEMAYLGHRVFGQNQLIFLEISSAIVQQQLDQRLEDDATPIRLHPIHSLEDDLIYLEIQIVSAALGEAIYYAVTLRIRIHRAFRLVRSAMAKSLWLPIGWTKSNPPEAARSNKIHHAQFLVTV